MSAKVNEPKKKTVKKPKTVSPEVVVNGTALKKAIAVREPVKIYNYGEVWGSRFEIDEDTFVVRRNFIAVPVDSKEDLANEPEKQKQLRAILRNKLIGLGYWTRDDKLIAEMLVKLESNMDELRHSVQYDEDVTNVSTVNSLKCLTNMLHEINKLIKMRRNLHQYVADGKLDVVPVVAPPTDQYHISNGKFVKDKTEEEQLAEIDKELGFKQVDLDDPDLPAPIRAIAEKFGKDRTVRIATMPTKK